MRWDLQTLALRARGARDAYDIPHSQFWCDSSDGVRLAGSRPWAELPAVYAAADLFVLPSRFEPWGAVVLEAMACGLPVIVSDKVGCAPDLVRPGENGWIVPAGDPDALAAALREALAEPEQLARMGGTSSRVSATWGEDACIESFVAAVNAALGETATFTSQVQKGKSPGCAG